MNYNALITLADRGLVTLPDSVDAAREAERRSAAARALIPSSAAELAEKRAARQRARAASWAAHVEKGTSPVDVAEHEAFVEWLQAESQPAQRHEVSARDTAISASADQLVREQLRPLLTAIIAEVREIAAVLPAHVTERAVLTTGRPEHRAAYERLTQLVDDYRLLREAQTALTGQDELAPVAEFKDAPALWGGKWRNRSQNIGGGDLFDPAPKDPARRLLFLATQAELWCPTKHEREEFEQVILRATKHMVLGRAYTLDQILAMGNASPVISAGSDSLVSHSAGRVVAPKGR